MKKLILIFVMMIGFSSLLFGQKKAPYTDMNVADFAQYIKGKDVQLVDVRTPEEYADGHIAGAENIDFYNPNFLNLATKELNKERPVAVYCRSGKRSAEAARMLAAKGYKVTNLLGGYMAWAQAGR